MFLPHPRVKVSIAGSLRDRDVACSASDRQGSNFESCVWRTVTSQSSHHLQEVLLARFSLYVHKGGLKPDSFHLQSDGGNNQVKTAVVWINPWSAEILWPRFNIKMPHTIPNLPSIMFSQWAGYCNATHFFQTTITNFYSVIRFLKMYINVINDGSLQ